MPRKKVTGDYQARWKRIEEVMALADLKRQREFAKALGVSDAAVSDWKNGRSNPDPEYYVRMYELSGLAVNYIWAGIPPRLADSKESPQMTRLRNVLEMIPEEHHDRIARYAEFYIESLTNKASEE